MIIKKKIMIIIIIIIIISVYSITKKYINLQMKIAGGQQKNCTLRGIRYIQAYSMNPKNIHHLLPTMELYSKAPEKTKPFALRVVLIPGKITRELRSDNLGIKLLMTWFGS